MAPFFHTSIPCWKSAVCFYLVCLFPFARSEFIQWLGEETSWGASIGPGQLYLEGGALITAPGPRGALVPWLGETPYPNIVVLWVQMRRCDPRGALTTWRQLSIRKRNLASYPQPSSRVWKRARVLIPGSG